MPTERELFARTWVPTHGAHHYAPAQYPQAYSVETDTPYHVPQWSPRVEHPYMSVPEPVALEPQMGGAEEMATFFTGITAAPIVVALAVYGMGRSISKRRGTDIEMAATTEEDDDCLAILEEEACEVDPKTIVVRETPPPKRIEEADGECLTILEEEACEIDPKSFVSRDSVQTEQVTKARELLKTGAYFAAWYFFNTAYNIYNKKALNAIALPWTAATIHLATGIPYVLFLWFTGLRATPSVSVQNLKNLSGVILGHLGTHVGGVIALGAGAVSFMQIVKASEPVVSCILSATMLGQVFSPAVYATLIPIVGGVGLASLKELSFTWLAFSSAMLSNVSSALRAILAKKAMAKPQGKNMTEANLYGVLTITCFALLLPMSLIIESPAKIAAAWTAANAAGISSSYMAFNLFMSGACYYLYNETAFLALGRVNAVTHAIANTVKRIVIIVASVIVFNTSLTPLGMIGSATAVAGAFLYAIAKSAKPKEAPKPAPAVAPAPAATPASA